MTMPTDLTAHYRDVRRRLMSGRPQPPKVDQKEVALELPQFLSPRLKGCPLSVRLRLLLLPIAERHKVTWDEVASPARHRRLRDPRREMWVALKNDGLSYPQIAAAFNRDHTTVLYGVKQYFKKQGRAGACTTGTR